MASRVLISVSGTEPLIRAVQPQGDKVLFPGTGQIQGTWSRVSIPWGLTPGHQDFVPFGAK